MAAKGLFIFAVLACFVAFSHANETPNKKTDGRLFSSGDTSLSIDTDGLLMLIVLAVIVGIVGVALGVFSNGKTDLTGYAAPSAYAASAPAYTAPAPAYAHEESAYTVHRSMEDAHNKYQ
ncbi:uncharacterized protein LOC122249131 [Penaeus japonicus]|uniref:uncharacterized protein LOC122249131 n=1 Tax=Penaeus japonicus TaxID=27405 RepID=UPI001C70E570|nr:uncharacterized protein LOC122249131 [Penaeus japonicus]